MYPAAAAAALAVAGVAVAVDTSVAHSSHHAATTGKTTAASSQTAIPDRSARHSTTTPIKHVVVIFDENISFDHYFGTYPNATNPKGESKFVAKKGTPTVNGLSPALLQNNLNKYNPTRLDPSQAVTCDMNHSYQPEQQAADHGLMDKFSEFTDSGDCSAKYTGEYYRPGLVMDYYDGNTVTGLWNYAQHYALSDNSYDTVYGPSTPGVLNLISGQTHGATASASGAPVFNGTLNGDDDPTLDGCGKGTTVQMSGQNIGDLLNKKNITWGWFQGGFKPTSRTTDGTPVCGATHANVAGASDVDYSPHHNPFEYYKSTANPKHLPPSSVSMIGKTDQANHEYDLSDFWSAADTGRLPEVSYLKAAEYQDGHAGYSDPIDEQHWLVNTINHIQKLPQWKDTAVVVAYDDSDGWYDHQLGPIVNASSDPSQDALSGSSCGTPAAGAYQDRCGYGPRLPMLVVSPYAKTNYVDHAITDQTSVLKFVEDNWKVGTIGDQSFDAKAGSLDGMFNFKSWPKVAPYQLDPNTGQPTGWH